MQVQQAELLSRLNDLDDQIASAMEIIRLQDQQLAQLRASLSEAAAQAAEQQLAAAEEESATAVTRTLPTQAAPASFLDSVLGVLSNSSTLLIVVVLVVLLTVMMLVRRNRAVTAEGLEEDFAGDLEPESLGRDLAGDGQLERNFPDREQGSDQGLTSVAALTGAGLTTAALAGLEQDDEDEEDDQLAAMADDDSGEDPSEWDLDDTDEEIGAAHASDFDEQDEDEEAELEADPEELLAEEDDSGDVIDFELESGGADPEAEDDDIEVLDFDIEDFLNDDEDEQSVDTGADDEDSPELDDGDHGVDFELDTDAGEEEEADADDESVAYQGIDYTSDSGDDVEPLEQQEADAEQPSTDDADGDSVETLDFDLSDTGIDEFDSQDSENTEAGDSAATAIETLDFSLEDDEAGGRAGSDRQGAADDTAVDFELNGQDIEAGGSETLDNESAQQEEGGCGFRGRSSRRLCQCGIGRYDRRGPRGCN